MYTDIKERQKIFGTAWEQVTEICPEIGGFIIDHVNKCVYMDDNALALIGVKAMPSYEKTRELFEKIGENDRAYSNVKVKIISDSSSCTAGIFRFMGSFEAAENTGMSVCTQEQLAAAMSDCGESSFLALIQIEESESDAVTELHIFSALSAIFKAVPKDTCISLESGKRFWVFIPDFDGDEVEYLHRLQREVSACPVVDELGMQLRGRNYLTFSAGCAAQSKDPAVRMRTAEFALIEAVSRGKGNICIYSIERFENQKNEYDLFRRFFLLIESNRFSYHFQPIVAVASGDIVAYEALMRTDSSVGMNPQEILDTASKLGRLYDIEKATLNNTLAYISENQEAFSDRKLFVNSIPAHILSTADWKQLEQNYGELMEKMVVELTEQTEIDDDSLGVIKDRLRRNNIRIAVDDYGSGYSNTTNLLRYTPDFVKIDRGLISGINEKPKIQKFVQGIIEFIHENGFEALAEGVETAEELRTVIKLGCDYIQGYYISKPKPIMLRDIAEGLRREIADLNAEFCGNTLKIYRPSNGEEVYLRHLSEEHYSAVFVETENVTIIGGIDSTFNMGIIIKDKVASRVVLKNVTLSTLKDEPLISLGDGSDVELVLEGENDLQNRGIWVPQTASLQLTGSGSLHILSSMTHAYGIGVDRHNSPGNIIIANTGEVHIECCCDDCVAIGGGKNAVGTAVQIISGSVIIGCSGGTCIGIGNFEGNSVVDMSDCSCRIKMNSATSLGIGSLKGNTDINCNNYCLDIMLEGLNLCGLGVIENGTGHIRMNGGQVKGLLKGRVLNGIGSQKGSISCSLRNSKLELVCEGSTASGIGDYDGSGDIFASDCEFIITMRAKDTYPLGSKDRITLDNCTKRFAINE